MSSRHCSRGNRHKADQRRGGYEQGANRGTIRNINIRLQVHDFSPFGFVKTGSRFNELDLTGKVALENNGIFTGLDPANFQTIFRVRKRLADGTF
jgi:hypothetical protein